MLPHTNAAEHVDFTPREAGGAVESCPSASRILQPPFTKVEHLGLWPNGAVWRKAAAERSATHDTRWDFGVAGARH
jgi:hypothetical protein